MSLQGIVNRVIVVSSFVVCSGCTLCIASGPEEMFTLASALTKLTTAVESKVRFENAPANLNDRELLQLATEHDPGLLDPFSEYMLKAVSQNNHAIVLVCTNDGMKALLEDAGCTSKMDMHWWKDQPDRPCEISQNLCVTKIPPQ